MKLQTRQSSPRHVCTRAICSDCPRRLSLAPSAFIAPDDSCDKQATGDLNAPPLPGRCLLFDGNRPLTKTGRVHRPQGITVRRGDPPAAGSQSPDGLWEPLFESDAGKTAPPCGGGGSASGPVRLLSRSQVHETAGRETQRTAVCRSAGRMLADTSET